MTDGDVKLLIDTLSAAVAVGQKVSVPAERVLELHARLLVAQMELAAQPAPDYRAEWERECDDTDALLRHLGLDPERCRTEGGSLNLPRIKTMLVEQRTRRHQFWGAGEPDCPPDIKAPNGELHTLRCKVCGDGWRLSRDVCFGSAPPQPASLAQPCTVQGDANAGANSQPAEPSDAELEAAEVAFLCAGGLNGNTKHGLHAALVAAMGVRNG